MTGSLASTLGEYNPLRYRSYVYDTETGLYYLQSRYYEPTIGRFLIPDIVFDSDAGLQGYDLFVYCGNNPVNRIDSSGADSCELESKEDLLDKEETEGGGPCGGQNPLNNAITNGTGYRVDSCNYTDSAPTNPSSTGKMGGKTSRSSFRNGLQKQTGKTGAGCDAHHIFPVKYEELFASIGINIHNPAYGAWWESSAHRHFSYEYNLWWEAFWGIDGVTCEDAFALANFLSSLFGFIMND